MEQGSGRHGTELTGGETEPRGTWSGAGGRHGTGQRGWLLEFMVFMMNITEEK